MSHKHQPYRKNNGFWSCSVCRWEFHTRPNKDNCPGILRIECANDEYKTLKQWRKLGFEPIPRADGDPYIPFDAISIVHSTDWHGYYHRDHVRRITMRALDGPGMYRADENACQKAVDQMKLRLGSPRR